LANSFVSGAWGEQLYATDAQKQHRISFYTLQYVFYYKIILV